MEYNRTLAGNEALLRRDDLSQNTRNALTMALEEKKQLSELLEFAETVRDALMDEDEVEGRRLLRRRVARKMFKPKVDYYLLEQLFPLIHPTRS